MRKNAARSIFQDDDPSHAYISSPPSNTLIRSQGASQANDDDE